MEVSLVPKASVFALIVMVLLASTAAWCLNLWVQLLCACTGQLKKRHRESLSPM
jgi:hypothetical protein